VTRVPVCVFDARGRARGGEFGPGPVTGAVPRQTGERVTQPGRRAAGKATGPIPVAPRAKAEGSATVVSATVVSDMTAGCRIAEEG
jgi:hypothetical protein